MNILIIEQFEDLRSDIRRRVEEASRSTGLRGITIDCVEMKQVGSSTPDLIILGSFAKDTVLEIHSRLNSIFPNVPIILLLNTNDYLEDAVELHKRTMIRIVALGDLPQISQILINLGKPTDKSSNFIGKARVVSLVNTKGGVGTSTIAMSLANYYNNNSISTLLIDLNISNRDLTIFCKYSIEGQSSLSKALKLYEPDEKTILSCVEKLNINSYKNISILGLPEQFTESYQLYTNQMISAEENINWLENAISKLTADYDVILIDVGNHWGPSALSSLALSTHICLITEEDEWCIKRTFSMMHKLSSESEDPGEFDFRKWKVVVNGIRSVNTATELVNKYNKDPLLIQHPQIFGIPWTKKCIDWYLGESSSYDLGEPLYKESIESLGKKIRPL